MTEAIGGREESPADGAAAMMAIVCFGEVPWDDSWKRNQSMVHELAARSPFDRVVFVDPREIWFGREFLRSGRSFVEKMRRVATLVPRRGGDGIWLCNLGRLLPFRRLFPVFARFEERCLEFWIRRLCGGRPFVLLDNHPDFFAPALRVSLARDAVLHVYDLSDDFVEFHADEENRARLKRSIERSCADADLVLVVNEHLRRKYLDGHEAALIVRNATNFENFNREQYRPVAALEEIRRMGGPVLGYTGTINQVRVDYELLESLLRARPDCQFVFVGSRESSFLRLVQSHRNLHLFDRVGYQRLPDYIAYFDVAIIPFQVNEHTLGNDLLKFNDYLAMGKPIVTTATGGAERYRELVWIAEGVDDFLAKLDRALEESSTDPIRGRRVEHARLNSWASRVEPLRRLIVERARVGRAG